MQALNQTHGDIGVQDKAIGLEVVHEATGTQNELDIAFMARNRLFVIECKTARIDKPQSSGGKPRPAKANDTLFKLAENCSRIGGLGAKGMLVSYRALNDPEMRLAKALGIAVVVGQETAQLPKNSSNGSATESRPEPAPAPPEAPRPKPDHKQICAANLIVPKPGKLCDRGVFRTLDSLSQIERSSLRFLYPQTNLEQAIGAETARANPW